MSNPNRPQPNTRRGRNTRRRTGSAGNGNGNAEHAPQGGEAAPQPSVVPEHLDILRPAVLSDEGEVTNHDLLNALYAFKEKRDVAHGAAYRQAFNRKFNEERHDGFNSDDADARTKEYLEGEYAQRLDDDARAAIDQYVDDLTPQFMGDVQPDNDEYAARRARVQQQLYQFAGTPREELDDSMAAPPLSPPPPPIPERTPAPETESQRKEREFNEARDTKYGAYVDRQRSRRYGKKAKAAREAYEQAEENYGQKLDAHLKDIAKGMAGMNGVDNSLKQINQAIIDKVNQIAREDAEAQQELLVQAGGKKAELLARYEKLSKGKKIAIIIGGVAVGATLAAGTGGLALAFGASGAVAGTAASGVAAGSAFGRTYALGQSKLYTEAIDRAVLGGNDSDLGQESNLFIQRGVDGIIGRSNKEIESGDKIKRRVFWTATGSAALVGAGVVVADVAAEGATSAQEVLVGPGGEAIGDWFQGDAVQAENGPAEPDSGGAGSETDNGTGEVTTSELFEGAAGTTEFTPEGLEDLKHWIDGYEVQQGDTVWDDVSREYLEHKGITDPSVYQIDAVKDSVLANTEIADAKGWLYTGDVIDTVPDSDASGAENVTETADSSEYTADATTIENGEGWADTMAQIDIPAEDRAALLEHVGPQLADMTYPGSDISVAYQQGGEWFMNMSPNAEMPQNVLDLITTEHMAMHEAALEATIAEQIDGSTLGNISDIPQNTGGEAFFDGHNLDHLWDEIDHNAAVGAQLESADPNSFKFENGALELVPNSHISDDAWEILAEHMTNAEKQRYGLPV